MRKPEWVEWKDTPSGPVVWVFWRREFSGVVMSICMFSVDPSVCYQVVNWDSGARALRNYQGVSASWRDPGLTVNARHLKRLVISYA